MKKLFNVKKETYDNNKNFDYATKWLGIMLQEHFTFVERLS